MGRGNQAGSSRSNPTKSPKRTVLRQNKTTGEFYVKIFLGGHTTWHFTSDGLHHLARCKIRVGDELPPGMFGYLRDKEWVFTGGSGAEPAEADDRYTHPRESRGHRPQLTSLPARPIQAKKPKGTEPKVKHGQARTDRPYASTIFLRPLRNDPTQERARSVADDPIVHRPDRTPAQQINAPLLSEPTPTKRRPPITPPRKQRDEAGSTAPIKPSKSSTSTLRQTEPTPARVNIATAEKERAIPGAHPVLQSGPVDQGPSSRLVELDPSAALNERPKIEPAVNYRFDSALPPFEVERRTPRDQTANVSPLLSQQCDTSRDVALDEAHDDLARWLRETAPAMPAAMSTPPRRSQPLRFGFLPLLLIICLILLALLAFSGVQSH